MWAHVENGRVIELTDTDPEGRYHASWIWVPCPKSVGIDWIHAGGVFSPPPALSLEALAAAERVWRNGELASHEWWVTRHRDEQAIGGATTLSSEQFSELLAYRKQLRDWPQGQGFPKSKGRPTGPAWLEAAEAA